jgi:hypothetical protein
MPIVAAFFDCCVSTVNAVARRMSVMVTTHGSLRSIILPPVAPTRGGLTLKADGILWEWHDDRAIRYDRTVLTCRRIQHTLVQCKRLEETLPDHRRTEKE